MKHQELVHEEEYKELLREIDDGHLLWFTAKVSTELDGHLWCLYQDSDLWAVCEELLTEEERENFGWNE